MSASLIGRLGSSTFRLSTIAVSMSHARSRFSSESAPGPFHHGIRGRGGTINRAALLSIERQDQADMQTHLIHRPARDIFPLLGGTVIFSYIGHRLEYPPPDTLLYRLKRRNTLFQSPNASGRSCQGEPVRTIHSTPSTNIRLSRPVEPFWSGRPIISGAIRSQAASLKTKRSFTPKTASPKAVLNLICT